MATSLPYPAEIKSLEGRWIGNIYGTDTGNVFVETAVGENGSLNFDFRINNNGNIRRVAGNVTAASWPTVNLIVADMPPDAERVTGQLAIDNFQNGRISGRWGLSNDAAGEIVINRSDGPQPGLPTTDQKPVEIVLKEEILPSVTIYRKDFEAIISRIQETIGPSGKAVVTAAVDGRDTTIFADDFLKKRDLPRVLHHVRLNISDNNQPFPKIIVITLSAKVGCSFSAQSADPTWTNGVHADLHGLFRRYTSPIRRFFQSQGLNLNGLVFLAAIAFLPDLPVLYRIVFLALVVLFMYAFKFVHNKLIMTTIYLDNTEQGRFGRIVPSIISSVLAAGGVAILGALYKLIVSNGLTPLIERIFGP